MEKHFCFEDCAIYLQRNVPPDDIYLFASNCLYFSMIFMLGWREKKNFETEMARLPEAQKTGSILEQMLGAYFQNLDFTMTYTDDENNNPGDTDSTSPA